MSIEADFGELRRLSTNLTDAPNKTVPFVRKAVEVTARNVKDDARGLAAAQSGRSAKHYPDSMEYELKAGANFIEAEVGPRPAGQGNLAPIFETGNPFSGRKPALEPALQSNVQDFVTGLGKALEDGLA